MEAKTELVRNCLADRRRNELDITQRAVDMNWINSRMEDGRTGQYLALIQREADMEREFQQRTDHAALVNAKAKYETKLALEIAKVDREEAIIHQRRRFLRQNDHELKELTSKLNAGYVCKDLQAQILHNKYRKLQEKAEEKRANDLLYQAVYSDQEAQKAEAIEKAKATSQYGQELRQQLVSRQRQKQCQYEDTLIEKKMLDDITRMISDEDKYELELKRRKQEKLREEMETFYQAKQAWRAKQRLMVVQEEKDVENQRAKISDRSIAIVEERKRRLREKEESNARIAAKVLAEKDAQQHRDDLIKLLQEQEYLEKNVQDDIEEKEKVIKVREITKVALLKQMEDKKRQDEEQRKKDEAYRKQLEEKMKREEEEERQKAIVKREKNKQHCELLLQQAQVHRQRAREAATDDSRRAKVVKEYELAWQAEVAEERKRIVMEHVPPLIGYLQAGVIGREDLPAVKEGTMKNPELAKVINIDALAHSKPQQRFVKCNVQCRTIRKY